MGLARSATTDDWRDKQYAVVRREPSREISVKSTPALVSSSAVNGPNAAFCHRCDDDLRKQAKQIEKNHRESTTVVVPGVRREAGPERQSFVVSPFSLYKFGWEETMVGTGISSCS